MSTLKVDQWLNLDGTENFKCRAWACLDLVTAGIAVRGSGNVVSVVDVGAGQFRLNLLNPMPDVNYAVLGCSAQTATQNTFLEERFQTGVDVRTVSSISFQVVAVNAGSGVSVDSSHVSVGVFR